MRKKIIALSMAIVLLFAFCVPASAGLVSSAENQSTSTGAAKAMEDIIKGLSHFRYKVYEWTKSLTVGSSAFSLAESIYTKRNNTTKKATFWNDDEITDGMKNFYSTTNWNNFEGMYETVEISNTCKAVLSEEVAAYEADMDQAAQKHGFTLYKEIFKAIAQTEYNQHKVEYQTAKKLGNINGTKDDKYDLFHINGSWVDGGNDSKTPIGEAAAPTPTPTPIPTPAEIPDNPFGDILVPTPTPMPTTIGPSELDKHGTTTMTVEQSIEYAATAFEYILNDAVFPSPYDTNALISIVQGFEFGGNSEKIRNRYTETGGSFPDVNGFITFEQFCDKQAVAGSTSESESREDIDYDSIIEAYANVIAAGKTRNTTEEYGKYKYSDQKFYEKVFENYKCSGGGSIELGNLPEDMKEILRQCMQSWDNKVTSERKAIIQQAVMLYGVTYSMDYRNSPSAENPKYLDCSSFVGQSYWRAGITDKSSVNWTTSTNSNLFREIDASQLIPGDIGQKKWPGSIGGSDHVGIYIGSINGTNYWIHCTGSGSGVKINNYGNFAHFGRYPSLS